MTDADLVAALQRMAGRFRPGPAQRLLTEAATRVRQQCADLDAQELAVAVVQAEAAQLRETLTRTQAALDRLMGVVMREALERAERGLG